MPRQPTQGEILAQFNALVPRARELGIRARTRAEWRGGRPAIQAKLDELRASIAQFVTPSIDGVERTFGCEFEFHMPRGMTRDQLSRLLKDAGIDNRVTSWSDKSISSWWKITTDGSLGNYATGTELVSPKLSGARGIELVQRALRVLISARCRVNRECGFHVHVGARGHGIQFFRNILHMYKKFEPVIDRVLTPSRRSNSYCATVRFDDRRLEAANTIDDLRNDPHLRSRFRKLNLDSYWRHGTVEFRQHQGTIEAEKATMWVRIALRMTAAALSKSKEDLEASEVSLAGFLKLVEAEASEAEYLHHRAAFFAHREARA